MGFLKTIDNFFTNYNYNTLWWYISDNYLPKFATSVINSYISTNINIIFEKVVVFLISLNSFFLKSLNSCDIIIYLGFTTNMINAIFIALKFLFCISLLIFARGGIPRFRFDYLTKLGWIRFLSLVLLSLLIEILLLSIF